MGHAWVLIGIRLGPGNPRHSALGSWHERTDRWEMAHTTLRGPLHWIISPRRAEGALQVSVEHAAETQKPAAPKVAA
jgi:hypothetical protein